MRENVVVLLSSPPPYGGVRLSAVQTFLLLKEIGEDIDYRKIEFSVSFRNFLGVFHRDLLVLLRSRVVLIQVNDCLAISDNRFLFWILLCKLCMKKIVFRGFAGGLSSEFKKKTFLKKKLILGLLKRMHVVTFQTKTDLYAFQPLLEKSVRLEWFPNSRFAGNERMVPSGRANRFCFVGKVWRRKGVHLLVDAARNLPETISIEIYGPTTEADLQDVGLNGKRLPSGAAIEYKGVIEPCDIQQMIRQYDCLVLPSSWKTEGHPGVILEAFSVGVPVIATNWNGIPEVVDSSCGLLIEKGSSEQLARAMRRLHQEPGLWMEMCEGARSRIKDFDPKYWTAKLHEWILETAHR